MSDRGTIAPRLKCIAPCLASATKAAGVVRSFLLLASPLDCDAMTLWVRRHVRCELSGAAAQFEEGLDACRRDRPRLAVLDPATAEDAVEQALALLRAEQIGHLLMLDQRPLDSRLVDLLTESSASYFSRAASSADLAMAIGDILEDGRRVFDPALARRLKRTDRGWELAHSHNGHSLAKLSARERQVMRLLAKGSSVRQCAQAMGLAHSTVDNHKSRLMKKLGVHKASELTVRAIREGLISP